MNMSNELATKSVLTIVVNTCDAYSDVLTVFFAALKSYWPDCIYPIVINTEHNVYNFDGAAVHNYSSGTGSDEWGARLISTLESIDSEFVLMLYDDYILEAAVDQGRFERALGLLKQEARASVVYLSSVGFSTALNAAENACFSIVKDYSDYRLNSAPAIWRRSDLLSYTGRRDNPWAWEVFGSYRTFGNGKIFYCPSTELDDIFIYNHRKGGAIYRGKWVREVVDVIEKTLEVDINYDLRGFSLSGLNEKRSLSWKLKFIKVGYQMIGTKVIFFIFRYVRAKLNGQ